MASAARFGGIGAAIDRPLGQRHLRRRVAGARSDPLQRRQRDRIARARVEQAPVTPRRRLVVPFVQLGEVGAQAHQRRRPVAIVREIGLAIERLARPRPLDRRRARPTRPRRAAPDRRGRRPRRLDQLRCARRRAQPMARERRAQRQPAGPFDAGRRPRPPSRPPGRARRTCPAPQPPAAPRPAPAPPRPGPASSSSARSHEPSASAARSRIGLRDERQPAEQPSARAGTARAAASRRSSTDCKQRGVARPPAPDAAQRALFERQQGRRVARLLAQRRLQQRAGRRRRVQPVLEQVGLLDGQVGARPSVARRLLLDLQQIERRPVAAGLDGVQAQRAQHRLEGGLGRIGSAPAAGAPSPRRRRPPRPRTAARPRSAGPRPTRRRGRRPPRPAPAPRPPTARASAPGRAARRRPATFPASGSAA